MKPTLRKILRGPEVLKACGYKESQLDEKIKEGKFPAPITLSEGGRARGWFEDEIIAHQEARRQERDAKLAAARAAAPEIEQTNPPPTRATSPPPIKTRVAIGHADPPKVGVAKHTKPGAR